MAPKREAGVASPAVADAIKMLEAGSHGLTSEGMKLMDPSARKRLTSAFQVFKQHYPEESKAYDDGTNTAERQAVLLKFVIDMKQGKFKVSNKEVMFNQKKDKEQGQWMTLEQVAAPGNENSMANAKLWAADVLPEHDRLHERPAYAKEGVHEYWYIKKMKLAEGGNRSEAALTHEADVEDPNHYKAIQEGMQLGMDQTAPPAAKKARKTPQKKDPDDPEALLAAEQKRAEIEKKKQQAKEVSKAQHAFTKSLTDCKTSQDRISAELLTVDDLKAKLAAKPYDTSQMEKFLFDETAKQHKHVHELSEQWKAGRVIDTTDLEVLAKCQEACDLKTKAANECYSAFVKNCLADMLKLTADR